MIQMLLGSVLPGLFKLGDKLIEDKDKRLEYAMRTQEMTFEAMKIMLDTKTYPWLDGLVKLSYASETIIKGLLRPVGALGLFVYGLMNPDVLDQLQQMGTMGDAAIGGMFGSFPAWIASRHLEKRRQTQEATNGETGW
jgi:hypothetical protein